MSDRAFADRLREEGLQPGTWANGPGEVYGVHAHGFDKVLVCAAGSITFGLPGERRQVTMSAGDRLELPAGTDHDATVGPAGVTYLEAHLPAGRLARPARRVAAGEW